MFGTASNYFVLGVRIQYDLALNQVCGGHVARHGINWYTDHAPPAYVMAVAAVEAFLNEIAFNPVTKAVLAQAPLWKFDPGWLERLESLRKLALVPHLLFDATFDRGAQPYQDMAALVKVRNEFVHYKLVNRLPPYVAELDRKGISLRHPSGDADYPWPHKMCSSEGIRWANNTAAATARALVQMMPAEHRSRMGRLVDNFGIIDENVAVSRLRAIGQDPGASAPKTPSSEKNRAT